jgi:hypothetical protein
MDLIQHARELAKQNFRVFPLSPLSKIPAKVSEDFPRIATTDLAQIEKWWAQNPKYNIGISTNELVVIDVDNKSKKPGLATLAQLRAEGKDLPETFEQVTPTKGHHLFYSTLEPIRQGVNVLGAGLDIRAEGGYVVGAGSRLPNGIYQAIPRAIRPAPDWLLAACKRAKERDPEANTTLAGIDRKRAVDRATRYLLNEAPLAIKGQGGDLTTYRVAATLKDLGVDRDTALILMLDFWNDRTTPGWRADRLQEKIDHAYTYGHNPVGLLDPGTQFDVVEPEPLEQRALSPIEKINSEYKYIAGSNGFVLHETTDEKGLFKIEVIDVPTFHRNLAARTMFVGERSQKVTELWVKDSKRETYDAIVFAPGKKVSNRFYNLWRGFSVEPTLEGDERSEAALKMWLTHAKENIAQGDETLFHWLISYFAHMIQRPWEKPLVALVLRGGKGVGKSAFVSRIRHLLGPHASVVSHRHRLTGNFNSVLENKLFLTLEEAFWSGDKMAEGVLKELITGDTHTIERKGHEPYEVDNCLRLAILGNDRWVVPASWDERRYAVFNVTQGRYADSDFHEMRQAMEAGGYGLLLSYLMNYDFSGVSFSRAPKSEGLLEQKIQSLDPFFSWWYDCINSGSVLGSAFEGWPTHIAAKDFRLALQTEMNLRNIRARLPGPKEIFSELKRCSPSAVSKSVRHGGEVLRVYDLPSLAQARKEWQEYIGHTTKWEDPDDADLFS